MRFIRACSLCAATLGLALSGAAFASNAKVKLAKASTAPNCDVNGKKHHYKSKDTCDKKKGKWLGDDASASAAGSTSNSTTTPSTSSGSPAATSPAPAK